VAFQGRDGARRDPARPAAIVLDPRSGSASSSARPCRRWAADLALEALADAMPVGREQQADSLRGYLLARAGRLPKRARSSGSGGAIQALRAALRVRARPRRLGDAASAFAWLEGYADRDGH
jgi:hypothetical protein